MQRVAIIGSAGSGKSVFARELATVTGLPLFHLDQLFWKPGWVRTPRDEWRDMQANLVAQERWIVDGNYGGTIELRLRAADTVVFFDLPRLVCLWGVLRRFVQYRQGGRPDMAPGLDERLSLEFIRWVWNYRTIERPRVLQHLQELESSTMIVRFTSRKDVRDFLNKIG